MNALTNNPPICDDAFKNLVGERLAKFEQRRADDAQGSGAAVAVAITNEGLGADIYGLQSYTEPQSSAALILTKRSFKLRRHAGQWALPGGRIDEGETPETTARREMHEEIGLVCDSSNIIGRLDDFVTRSGFVITPVVFWIGCDPDLTPNPDEVASIHRIPLSEFLREDSPMLDHDEGEEHPVLRMPVGDNWIAAPTAAIIYQFREVCVLDKPTRVAHFDQPKFAWR
ncbi:MAG: CoA pyrophosphatase [Pseudomonadota bacterium]